MGLLGAFGAFVGRALGSGIGVHAALALSALGATTAVTWLVVSPVRLLHAAPEPWREDQALAVMAEVEAETEVAPETHRAPIELRS